MTDETETGMSADEIPRSRFKLDRKSLVLLLQLNMSQPWLESRQAELLELIDLCQDFPEQELICELLHRFSYMTLDDFASELSAIADTIVSEWKFTPEETIIVSINRSRYADSSEATNWMLKSQFANYSGWGTINFFNAMSDAADSATNESKIVMIEEFIGSGATIKKALEWMDKRLLDRGITPTLKVYSVSSMEAAKEVVEKTGHELLSRRWLKRGISDHYSEPALERARVMMKRLESALNETVDGRKLKDHHFGYKATEALYHLKNGNTPNNVFPIFWWKLLKGNVSRRPLLNRAM